MQRLAMVGAFCVAFIGCLQNPSSGPSTEVIPPGENAESPIFGPDLNVYPLNKLICDPFDLPEEDDDLGVADPDLGLKLEFYDLSEAADRSDELEFDHATRLDAVGFTSHLELRGQSFRGGIKKLTGEVLRAKNGDVLPAPFGMKIRGQLMLGQGLPNSDYQFAVLSNAPVRFRMLFEGEWVDVVPKLNTAVSVVEMACSTQSYFFQSGVSYPIEIDVVQTDGEQSLGLVPIWRLKPKNGKLDPFCENRERGQKFFDESPRKTPLPAYRSLQARGWLSWKPENIRLPENEDVNPCVESEEVPKITQFQFEFSGEQIFVNWQTDIPATSQVLYTRSDTGVEVLTMSDNVLRTVHRVAIPKNPSGVSYIVRAISVSKTNSKSISGGYTIYGF